MRLLPLIFLLFGLFFAVACGEEGDDSRGEAVEFEETAKPSGDEFSDLAMVSEIVDRLYTAVAQQDREAAMAVCFPPLSVIAQEKGLNEEERLAAEVRRNTELKLFEQSWAKLTEPGTKLLEWTFEVTGVTAPAGGEFYLVVYTVDAELLIAQDGNSPETVKHSLEIYYLNNNLLYAPGYF